MEDDDRFKHLVNDPRFRTLRKQQRKVKIDKRFQSMFTDERFTLQYKRDKRGRVIDKSTSDDLKNYYDVAEDDEDDEENDCEHVDGSEKTNKVRVSQQEAKRRDVDVNVDADRNDLDEEDADDESSEVESESSSSSDEPESSDEEVDTSYLAHDWNDLDKDAPLTERATHRIAICNVDWDRLNATDLFVVVSSFRTPKSLKIYLSEFGRERLKEEERRGPTELVELPTIKEDDQAEEEDDNDNSYESDDEASDQDDEERSERQGRQRRNRQQRDAEHVLAINHYEDEEDADNVSPEVAERIRQYQLNRLKYYYAVVEFDTPEDANHVYNELDGMEYEGSSSALDLRFIPDDMDFNQEPIHNECHEMPDLVTYQAPQFITTALQQSKVRLTWEETDPKRRGKLRKSYTQEELEKDDLDAYLASETDSSSNYELDKSDDSNDDDNEVGENDDQVNGNQKQSSEEKGKKDQSSRIAKYRKLLMDVEAEQRKREKVDLEIEWDDGVDGDQATNEIKETSDGNQSSGDEENDLSSEQDSENDVTAEDSDSHEESSHDSHAVDDPLESDDDRSNGKRKKRQRMKRERKRRIEPEPVDPTLDLMVIDTNEGETERKHFNYRRITGEEKSKKRNKKGTKEGDDEEKADDFLFNPDDERFTAVYESHMYNIDPSDRRFKRTAAYEELAKRKRQRRCNASN